MKDKLRVKRKTLQAVLEQCQRALESFDTTGVLTATAMEMMTVRMKRMMTITVIVVRSMTMSASKKPARRVHALTAKPTRYGLGFHVGFELHFRV
ncbi:hypothetical protein ACE6H2_002887 [Prunus campanulata]